MHSIVLFLPMLKKNWINSLINSLWQIMWFKTTFEVQGTTYAVPFSLSRLCMLSNGVGGSQWLLVIQRETGCHYAFVLNLRSHRVVSCLFQFECGSFLHQPWIRLTRLFTFYDRDSFVPIMVKDYAVNCDDFSLRKDHHPRIWSTSIWICHF